MLNIDAEMDLKQWDRKFTILDAGLHGSGMNKLAGRALAGIIREDYDNRFKKAYGKTKNQGVYASIKEELGFDVGFLTGESQGAITSDGTDSFATVFLAGTWPGFDFGGEYGAFEPENFADIDYGDDRTSFQKDGEIHWMVAYAADAAIIARVIDNVLNRYLDNTSSFNDLTTLLLTDPSEGAVIPESFLATSTGDVRLLDDGEQSAGFNVRP